MVRHGVGVRDLDGVSRRDRPLSRISSRYYFVLEGSPESISEQIVYGFDVDFVARMEASHLRLLVVILCHFLLLSVNSSAYTWMYCVQQSSQFATHQEFTWRGSRCTMGCNSVRHQVTCQSRLHGSICQLCQSSFYELHGSLCKTVRGWMVSQ